MVAGFSALRRISKLVAFAAMLIGAAPALAAPIDLLPPTATMSAARTNIGLDEGTELTITLINPNASAPLGRVALTGTYGGMTLVEVTSNSCRNSFVSLGDGTVFGVTGDLAAGESCTIVIYVRSYRGGTGVITPLTLAQDEGSFLEGTPPAAVSITFREPYVTMSLSPGSVEPGANSTLTITINNPMARDLGSIVASGTLAPNLQFGQKTGTCGSFFSAGRRGGSGSFSVNSSNISPGSSCTTQIPVTAASPGSYPVTVTSFGSAYFSGNFTNPDPVSLTVTAPLTPTTTTVTATPNPQAAGEAVALSASVSASGQPVQAGSVAFEKGGQPIDGCAEVAIAGVAATCNLPGQEPGEYQIVARFTPAADSGVASSNGTTQLYVNPAGPADQSFVGGEGDDANSCTRTAPCQTFQRALEMTNDGGTITCVSPGGFGPVTIDKAVSIQCLGMTGGVMASGENGITIAAPADAIIVLDGLDLEGLGQSENPAGQNGITFVSGRVLTVRNSSIRGFGYDYGIMFMPGGNATLTLDNVTLIGNGSSYANSGGLLVAPRSAGVVKVNIRDSRMIENTTGIRIDTGSVAGVTVNASIADTSLNGNRTVGLNVRGGTLGVVRTSFERGRITGNATGVLTQGALSRTVIGRTVIHENAIGLSSSSGGQNQSSGGNRLTGTTPGSFDVTIPLR